jgi:hypothetical protein
MITLKYWEASTNKARRKMMRNHTTKSGIQKKRHRTENSGTAARNCGTVNGTTASCPKQGTGLSKADLAGGARLSRGIFTPGQDVEGFKTKLIAWLESGDIGEPAPDVKPYMQTGWRWCTSSDALEKAYARLELECSQQEGVLYELLATAEFSAPPSKPGGYRILHGKRFVAKKELAQKDRVLAQTPAHMYARRKTGFW